MAEHDGSIAEIYGQAGHARSVLYPIFSRIYAAVSGPGALEAGQRHMVGHPSITLLVSSAEKLLAAGWFPLVGPVPLR